MPTNQIQWRGEHIANGPTRDGYRLYRLEGYIYDPRRPQPAGSRPLYSWWNPDRRDNFSTTQHGWTIPPDELQWRGEHIVNGPARDGYRCYRLEGYVF